MEDINRIEIQGRVGNIRTNVVNDTMVANFSVATDYYYKGRDGAMVNETTWHQVVAWAGKGMVNLNLIEKGSPVNVIGRMRSTKLTSSDGTDKYFYEIMAQKVRIVPTEETDS